MVDKKTIKTGFLVFDGLLLLLAIFYSIKFKSILFTFLSFAIIALILGLVFPQKVKKALQDRGDLTLAGISLVSLFLYDINVNKIADKGLDHQVTIIGGLTTSSTFLFWIALSLMILTSFILLIRAITNKKGNITRDLIFGGLFSLIGLIALFGGALLQFYFTGDFKIPFFNTEILNITFYHIFGIGFYIEAFFYYILTR